MTNTKKIDKHLKRTLFVTAICIVICMVAIGGFAAYLLWGWKLKTEQHAICNDDYTIWRQNPGAWSSYIFEIRKGNERVESGLRSRDIRDFLVEHNCKVLGGG